MNFPPALVTRLLQARGANFLFHANTVTTACSLLRSGSLLSRAGVEKSGLPQTGQYTDDVDRECGVWDSVFLDTTDIHDRIRRHNNYGPVVLKFSTTLLGATSGPGINITQSNPSKWKGLPDKEKWFQHKILLQAKFTAGNFDQIIVIPSPNGSLNISAHLVEVILDDPQSQVENQDAYSSAEVALRKAASEGGISSIKISKRICRDGCECVGRYQANDSFRWKFFSPNVGS